MFQTISSYIALLIATLSVTYAFILFLKARSKKNRLRDIRIQIDITTEPYVLNYQCTEKEYLQIYILDFTKHGITNLNGIMHTGARESYWHDHFENIELKGGCQSYITKEFIKRATFEFKTYEEAKKEMAMIGYDISHYNPSTNEIKITKYPVLKNMYLYGMCNDDEIFIAEKVGDDLEKMINESISSVKIFVIPLLIIAAISLFFL